MKRFLAVLSLCVFLLSVLAEGLHVHEPDHGHVELANGAAAVDGTAHACLLCKVVPETLIAPAEGPRTLTMCSFADPVSGPLPCTLAGAEVRYGALRGPPIVA